MKIGKAELESVALRKDGSTFDVFLSASKYVDNSGKIFFPTFFKDITQKKQQERELEHHRDNLEKLVDQKSKALVESEQRFRILFDDSPTGIYETDADGNCLMVNKRWQEMAGMTQKEALGNNWINGIYEPDRQEIFKLWKKYADTGQSWSQEYRFCTKEGKITWVYGIAKPLFDENNKIIGYIGNNTDITEQKQAQLEVKNQRDMFETVINSVPSRIFWKDKKGVYLGCNPNFAMDAGMKSINDVIGKKDESFIWGDDAEKYRADDREVMESGIPKLNYEEPFIGKNGNKFIWQTNKMPLRNNNGEIIGIIAISENITEEKKVADEIIKSQKRYQSLFDNSPTPLWDEDFSEVKKFVDKLKRRNIKDFREYFKRNPEKVAECSKLIKIVDVNQAAVKLHEANSKEELYQGLSIIFTEKSYEAFVEELIAIAEGRHEIVFEGTLKTIHGRELEILLKWQVVPGYEDTLEKVYISSSDITALKQAEEKIKDSEAKFRLIAENSVDFIWQMDLRLNFTYASPAIYGLTGHTAEEWLGSNLANHCSRKELFKMARQAFGAIRNYKKIQSVLFESKIYKKDGEEIPVEIIGKLIFNKKGLPIALQGSTRDISERKKASQILRQSEERYRHIFETAANLITAVDKDGIIVDCNNRLKEILGYEKDKIVGQSITSLLHPDHHDKIFTSLNKIIEEGHDYNQTYKMMRHDGRIIDVNINASAIDNNGVFERTICIIEDITEQLQIQQELLYAKEKAEESNRLKSEFLHNMSHEIRTPMNGIMGFSNLLSEQESSNDNIKNYTSIIHNCSNQLLRIIDDILEISILETKQQKFANNNFHINDFIMEQFAIFDLKAKERKLPFYVKKGLPNDNCIINSDKSKLNKIVSNLLENAFKFTSEGYIELGYYIEDKYLVLYVQDTGLGISEANVDRIFKRFSQESHDIAESHGGLGLGLAIAKENAQLLGGDITVKTQKGEGSIFYVRLPYIANADKKFNHKKQQEQEEATAKKVEHQILIAEDEEINYLYLETVLNSIEKIKCKLIHAKNGKEAVEICLREQNLSLVLMDIKMPIMNGFEATEKIKTIYPKLPIIAQTAYSTEAEKDLAIKHGCDDFISKPIQKQNLFRLIDKYLSFS
jgi:PAS domain S-box-containing protein